jgi:hypothetical protein
MIAREIHETRAVAKALPEWIWCRFELGFRPRTMATGRRLITGSAQLRSRHNPM